MNSYYSNTLPPPPPNYYPPNYNHPPPPGPPPSNYNYNYPPQGPPGPPHNYNYAPSPPPPQNPYYNNHNHTNAPFPHPPSPQPPTLPPSALTITSSPHDSSLTLLTSDTTPHAPPQYTAKINTTQKPQITLSRSTSHAPLGTATMHTFSSTTDCSLSEPPTSFPVKYSSLSGNFAVSHPLLGNYKWKANQLTGTSLELVDGTGHKLAKIKVISGMSGLTGSKKSKGKGKGKKLELYVPLQQPLLDVVVLSGLVAMVGTRGMMEAGVEVFGAVVGV